MAWALDLDGVVWLGDHAVPGAAGAVDRLQKAGEQVLFVTNNSGRTVTEVETRLAEFGTELEDAWDVPRALSLPGLADSLGVVRSALHAPLSSLESEGYATTRSAHVIGGGSRRRTVVHITDAGREAVAESEAPSVARTGRAFGPIPDQISLHGGDQISVVFLGDGSVEEGVFYESVNFAVLKKLPVLFVCENNFFSVFV